MRPAQKLRASTMSPLTQWRSNSTGHRWRQSLPPRLVQSAEYNALYYPNLSESYKIINAQDAWNAAGGRSNAGAGIKIGDIDAGIEETHPFFDPTGFSYPPGFPKCDAQDSNSNHKDQDCRHVTSKVIVAKVFYNKARNQSL